MSLCFRRIFLSKFPKPPSARAFADCGGGEKGLLLGAYDGCNPDELKFTAAAEKVNEEVGCVLADAVKGAGIKLGTAQVFSNIHPEYPLVAVAGVGRSSAGMNNGEYLDECKENIRIAAGVGAKRLKEKGAAQICVEGFTDPEPAAEGATLGVWDFERYKAPENKSPSVKVELYEHPDREGWTRGQIKAAAQNLARKLEETPANRLTPSKFAQKTIDTLCPCGVQVDVRDKDWLEMKKMQAFLKVSSGSCESPLLMELGYCGGNADDRSVLLVGKGMTFDCGGVNLKKCEGMSTHRADMAGAAVIVGTMRTIAQLNLPINVQALIPCAENMLGGMAMKPGDVVIALNGKTIRIENTDHDARIVLADLLTYAAKTYKPCLLMSIASLTRGHEKALGAGCSAVFTTADVVWQELKRAGAETGDRVWRFPFWKHFHKKVTDYIGVDVNNVGLGTGALCLGASFLKEFVPKNVDFAHLDITGTGLKSHGIGYPYLKKGLMTGRPTRTISQFFYQMACPHEKLDCSS